MRDREPEIGEVAAPGTDATLRSGGMKKSATRKSDDTTESRKSVPPPDSAIRPRILGFAHVKLPSLTLERRGESQEGRSRS